ncbi:MAG: hypothetical protein QOG04_880 [Actinomycetota bacterium]|nr:hypothetical protein [Actinomycetota bacterium]
MNDFERKLQEALKNATSDYRPTDQHEAKQRFMKRVRRRRIAFAGGSILAAGAAAAIAFVLLPGQLTDRAQDDPLLPAVQPNQISVVQVGKDPSGIAFGADAVWVANTADGTVQVIDPQTNRVAETHAIGGSPDDVAVGLGAAWASDSGSGVITKMVFGQPDGPDIQIGEPGAGNHLDVAPGSGAIWVVAEDDSLYRIDPVTNEVIAVPTDVEGISDVAAGQDRVVVLGTSALASVDPASLVASPIADVDPSNNQDLQMSEGAVWVANGDAGEVTRFDLSTGEAGDPVYVGGNFTAIASGEGAMWMVSGDEGDRGNLTRIDPDSATIIGRPVSIGGRPYDVTTGAGSVWVVSNSAGSVTRLDPNALPEEGGSDPQEMGRPLFAFAADGELYVEDVEGHLTQVTSTPEEERYPSLSPDANSVAFQRGPGDPGTEVIVLDLLTGDESVLGDGEWPSFGPDGRVAYVVNNRGPDAHIAIARPGFEDNVEITPIPDSGDGPVDVRNIAWDLSGEYIYYQAGWEGFAIYQAPAADSSDAFVLSPRNDKPDANLSAPFVRGRDSVNVLQQCCGPVEGPDVSLETAELGLIRFTEGGPQYSAVVSIDPRDIAPADLIADPSLASAGHLMLAGGSVDQRSWRQGSARSWMIATSHEIWLIDERGATYLVSEVLGLDGVEFAGVSMAPQYRQ